MLIYVSSATSAIDIEDVKTHLAVNWTQEDDLIQGYIDTATELIEKHTGTSLHSTNWKELFDDFPLSTEPIQLMKRPVTGTPAVAYYDASGVSHSFTSFRVLSPTYLPAQLWPVTYWPIISNPFPRPDQVTITYTAGAANNIGKQAILLLVSTWYKNRDSELVGTISTELKHGLDRLYRTLDTRGYY